MQFDSFWAILGQLFLNASVKWDQIESNKIKLISSFNFYYRTFVKI